MLSSQLRFDKIFQSMDPQVDFLMAMFFAQLDDIFIPIPGDEKVEKIFPHAQFSAKMNYPLIKIIHFEQRQQNVVI